MSSLSSIALSGMSAAQTALGVAGHNIANAATAGFHRQLAADSSNGADGGVTTRLGRAPAEGADLAADLVGLLQAKNSFVANLQVFRTGDRMTASLLDAVA